MMTHSPRKWDWNQFNMKIIDTMTLTSEPDPGLLDRVLSASSKGLKINTTLSLIYLESRSWAPRRSYRYWTHPGLAQVAKDPMILTINAISPTKMVRLKYVPKAACTMDIPFTMLLVNMATRPHPSLSPIWETINPFPWSNPWIQAHPQSASSLTSGSQISLISKSALQSLPPDMYTKRRSSQVNLLPFTGERSTVLATEVTLKLNRFKLQLYAILKKKNLKKK